jgi:hypothetical protein
MTAERLLLMAGIAGFITIVHWVRKRELREKYAIGWLLIAGLALAICLYPKAVVQFAQWAKLSNATAVLFGTIVVLLLFCFSVSVSLSRSYKNNKMLFQELALLEKRVRELEQKNSIPSRRDIEGKKAHERQEA